MANFHSWSDFIQNTNGKLGNFHSLSDLIHFKVQMANFHSSSESKLGNFHSSSDYPWEFACEIKTLNENIDWEFSFIVTWLHMIARTYCTNWHFPRKLSFTMQSCFLSGHKYGSRTRTCTITISQQKLLPEPVQFPVQIITLRDKQSLSQK